MLLRYFTFVCLLALILIDYVLRYIAEGFLSLETITESKRLVTYAPY
jgi:hypothetical protein